MSEVNRTIKAIIEDRLDEVHTALPARIESYDAKTMYAKVVLLNKKELEGEQVEIPPVVEVPVAHLNAHKFIIRPPYVKGDIVQVIFNERALDKLLITGESEETKLTRKFSYDDAVVVKGLKLESETDLNSSYTEDLLIENREENSRIVMKANGDLLIETNGNTDVSTTGNTTIQTDGSTEINTSGSTDIISGSPATITAPSVTISAGTITNTGTTNIGGGGPAVARLGDVVEVEVTGGSSAGTYTGTIITAASNSFAG